MINYQKKINLSIRPNFKTSQFLNTIQTYYAEFLHLKKIDRTCKQRILKKYIKFQGIFIGLKWSRGKFLRAMSEDSARFVGF